MWLFITLLSLPWLDPFPFFFPLLPTESNPATNL